MQGFLRLYHTVLIKPVKPPRYMRGFLLLAAIVLIKTTKPPRYQTHSISILYLKAPLFICPFYLII